MLIDNSQQKLAHAIIYFVENTSRCRKVKLFKLLYFLDFQHYSQTGRSVTGLDYFAWPKGPVPSALNSLLEDTDSALSDYVKIEQRKTSQGGTMLQLTPLTTFSDKLFSKRELRILDELSKKYKSAYANQMIEETHLEKSPWHEIYEIKGLKQEIIPYDLALKQSEYGQVIKNAIEHNEFEQQYQ